MKVNIIDAYNNFSYNNIIAYNNLLFKYLYDDTNSIDDSLNKALNKFVKHYIEDRSTNFSLNSIILFLSNNIKNFEILKEDGNFIQQFDILSNSIIIAIELDRANSIVNYECSFEDVLTKIFKRYEKQFNSNITLLLEKRISSLKNLFNQKRKIISKVVSHYNNLNIDFELLELTNNKFDIKWFQVFPKYNFKQLKLDASYKIQDIIEEQRLTRDIFLIVIDKLNYELLKIKLLEKKTPNFIIELPKNFLKTKTNIKTLVSLITNESIVLEIDYGEIVRYFDSIQFILKNKVSIVANKIPKKFDSSILEMMSFISLSDDNNDDIKLLEMASKFKIPCILTKNNMEITVDESLYYLVRRVKSSRISKEFLE